MKDVSQEAIDKIFELTEAEMRSEPQNVYPHPRCVEVVNKIKAKYPNFFEYMQLNIGEFFREQDEFVPEEELTILFNRVMHIFTLGLRMMDLENNGKDIMEQ